MIISHKYKFIFIKTKKTAGTSLEIALSKFLDAGDVITPISPEDENSRIKMGFRGKQNFHKPLKEINSTDINRFFKKGKKFVKGRKKRPHFWPEKYENHMEANKIKNRVGQTIWDNYFKFAIERNPWDLAVSGYYWANRDTPSQDWKPFPDFIREGGAYWGSNFDRYSINGVPATDFLGRFENLDSDLDWISKQIGLPESLKEVMEGIKAKSQTRKKKSYRDLYDEESKRIVEIQFGREINLLGFEF